MRSMKRISSQADIDAVAVLAREVWTEHFTPIIGEAQVAYMLDTLQSPTAIARQIGEEGYEYYLVSNGNEPVGYFALVSDERSGSMQLSKLYLKRAYRGRGWGKAMLSFVEQACTTRGIRELWLTVNKNNTGPIAFYRQAGFTIAKPVVTDIGNGFVMDDYRMIKRLAKRPAGSDSEPDQS